MRIAWALVALAFFSFQWKDVALFYGNTGILPPEMEQFMVRGDYRFTLLTWVTDPTAVSGLYGLLLVALTLAALGVLPRLSVILSTLLIFSFHERNPFILGGGDTMLRHIGLLLCIAPEIRALSLSRVPSQWAHFREHRSLLPALTMPVWPVRMLLWQLIVLYGTSLWFKALGTMWLNGTAVAAALHHPMFARFPKAWMDTFAPLTPTIDTGVMLFHVAWVFLLVPAFVVNRLPRWIPRFPLKRTLLMAGVLFHGGIFIMMDAGCFSLTMMSAYCGCLLADDFDAIRDRLNCLFLRRVRKMKSKRTEIAVLYDGRCGLCLRSAFFLELADTLGRLHLVNFRNRIERMDIAPDVTEATLDRAMHIRFPDDSTLTGFDAFRALTWHLPVLWPAAPFLYLPGVAPVGRRVYAHIAERRKRCSHASCTI